MYIGQCMGLKLGRSIAQLVSVGSFLLEVPSLIFGRCRVLTIYKNHPVGNFGHKH